MTGFRKIVQCPSCRFANRLGDKRCIICKAELPKEESPPGAASPPAPPSAAPKAAAPVKPAGSPARPVLNPASNAAANARIAAAKSAPSKPSASGAPGQPSARGGAPGARPAEPGSARKPGSRSDATVANLRPRDDSLAAAPKPHTTRIIKGGETSAVAWLWCEPLAPIPLGVSREVTVGRQDKCDLVLPHKEVSRHHASFKVSGRQITLEDQGSSNGCYVNGKRCASQIVKVGDLIQIGPYEIEIRATGVRTEIAGEIDQETKSFDLTRLGSGAANASMTGKLSDVALVEILQGIEFNEKTCTLTISDGRIRGHVVFLDGRPLAATFGAVRDLEAVRAMLRLKEGRFVLASEVEPVEATMNMTVTGILLEASREIDEAGRAPGPDAARTADGTGADGTGADGTGAGAGESALASAPGDPTGPDDRASLADGAASPGETASAGDPDSLAREPADDTDAVTEAEAPHGDERAPGDRPTPAPRSSADRATSLARPTTDAATLARLEAKYGSLVPEDDVPPAPHSPAGETADPGSSEETFHDHAGAATEGYASGDEPGAAPRGDAEVGADDTEPAP